MKFNDITFDIFKRAVRIYIDEAYPKGVKTSNFCFKNIDFLVNAKTIPDLLKIFEEQVIVIDETFKKTKYTARLGSEQYPFLKLVLQETELKGEFGFLVDRHTEYLALIGTSKSFDKEVEIKNYTRELKYKIEEIYESEDIPTYRNLVRSRTKALIEKKKNNEVPPNGINIIVVEDDIDVLDLHKLSLELLGYTVGTAENGEDAINKVHNQFFDVMLLDLMMPVMNGFDIIARIADEIPIIVLTSLFDNESKTKCLTNGARAVLTKPIEAEIIDRYIKNTLKK